MADGTAIMDGADGVGEAGGPELVSISARVTATTDTGTIRTMDTEDTTGITGGIIATGATIAITIATSCCFEELASARAMPF
jgi:hypothetical protein